MKVDVLQFFNGGKADAKKGVKAAPGFQAALEHKLVDKADKAPRPEKEEKKLRPSALSTADELLLVSRAATVAARPVPVIGTKPAELKGAKVDHAQQVSARAHGQVEHARVTSPSAELDKKHPRVADAKPERDDPKLEKKSDEPKTDALTAPTAPTGQPTVAEPFRLEAPASLKDAAPLAQVAPLMLDDASVRAVLLPTVARVSMDTGEAGQLNLQLKVNDGVTEVRATGPAAPLLEMRQGELRVALAKEGLALGHFDLSQGGHQPAERPELDLAPPTARRASSAETTATEDGRVHVKA